MSIRKKVKTEVEPTANKDKLDIIADRRAEAERIWTLMREELFATTTPATYGVFFEKLVPIGLSEEKIILKSNSRFLINTIEFKYTEMMRELLCKITGHEMGVQLVHEYES